MWVTISGSGFIYLYRIEWRMILFEESLPRPSDRNPLLLNEWKDDHFYSIVKLNGAKRDDRFCTVSHSRLIIKYSQSTAINNSDMPNSNTKYK